ncbi:MAG TPA: VIT1/CCC1 transporter family protein [Methylocella sp.]|nr:VIT1/CCC1 transporter family protein [Methylocella sp.]
MPATPHIEKHFLSSALVRDIAIGMADGLTVPFALAAGLAGALSSTAIIIAAGLPLLLYFVLAEVSRALSVSIALALAALLIFGGIEGQLTGARPLRSAVRTALIGFLAAATAFGIARLVDR